MIRSGWFWLPEAAALLPVVLFEPPAEPPAPAVLPPPVEPVVAGVLPPPLLLLLLSIA